MYSHKISPLLSICIAHKKGALYIRPNFAPKSVCSIFYDGVMFFLKLYIGFRFDFGLFRRAVGKGEPCIRVVCFIGKKWLHSTLLRLNYIYT